MVGKLELDVIVTFQLEGRRILKSHIPVIDFQPDEEAIIVIDISVDTFGNIVESKWNLKKTSGDYILVLEQTLNEIRKAKFNRLPYNSDYDIKHYTSNDYLSNPEPKYQEGIITVTFFVIE
jgi:hypothetical protein